MFQKATSFIHGRGKDFFQRGREGATGRFFQHFSRVGKSGELFFFPLKTKQTILLAKDFKILLPTPMCSLSTKINGFYLLIIRYARCTAQDITHNLKNSFKKMPFGENFLNTSVQWYMQHHQ